MKWLILALNRRKENYFENFWGYVCFFVFPGFFLNFPLSRFSPILSGVHSRVHSAPLVPLLATLVELDMI